MESPVSLNPLTLATALGAGVISFASPCVLPLVPAYLGFITGRSAEELRSVRGRTRLAVAGQGLSFVLGLASIFTLLGASATVLGQTLLQNLPFLLKLAGMVVVLFGLHMLGVVRIPLLYRTARVSDVAQHADRGYVGAFIMGLAFGAGWTPCIGPFLAGVLTLAAAEETVAQGVVLLLVYALGLGAPFLLAALAVDRSLGLMRALRPHLGMVEKASGILLIGMGVLLFTERFTLITVWLTRIFGTGLTL
jgi:cytochrome c-type biogenesis protein